MAAQSYATSLEDLDISVSAPPSGYSTAYTLGANYVQAIGSYKGATFYLAYYYSSHLVYCAAETSDAKAMEACQMLTGKKLPDATDMGQAGYSQFILY